MCVSFHNQDAAYDAWRTAHPDGMVFNHGGGSHDYMNVLHRRADCPHLNRQADAGRRTIDYLKYCCAVSRACIEATANRLRGGRTGWVWCGECQRRGEVRHDPLSR